MQAKHMAEHAQHAGPIHAPNKLTHGHSHSTNRLARPPRTPEKQTRPLASHRVTAKAQTGLRDHRARLKNKPAHWPHTGSQPQHKRACATTAHAWKTNPPIGLTQGHSQSTNGPARPPRTPEKQTRPLASHRVTAHACPRSQHAGPMNRPNEQAQ